MRANLVQGTGLDMACVSKTVQYLIEHGIVEVERRLPSAMGRKSELLRIAPQVGYFVAVDLEGSPIRFGLADFAGELRFRVEEPVTPGKRLDLRTIVRGVKKVLAAVSDDEASRVLGIGVSCPGLLDRNERVTALNIGWKGYPLGKRLSAAAKLPVFVGSRKLTKLLAECWFGAARGASNCIHVTVSNGIGIGALVNGMPLMGKDGYAGEVGHMVIDPSASDRCSCGKTGCLEAVASSPQIVRQYLERTNQPREGSSSIRVGEVFERARSGDRVALDVIERAAQYLALGAGHLINAFNPELIVFSGDIAQAPDLFLPRIEAQLTRYALPQLLPGCRVVMSSLGADIGLVGAIALAFHGNLFSPNIPGLARPRSPSDTDSRTDTEAGREPQSQARRFFPGDGGVLFIAAPATGGGSSTSGAGRRRTEGSATSPGCC